MRRGIFAEPRTYRAWVRFSGPGPYVTPDIDDVGFMSMSIKLMGVPGPKLLDDEQFTQDMIGRLDADVRHARHARQRAAPVLELPERVGVLLRQLPRLAHPRLDHAAALDEDAVEPARGRVLQLRPVPARRGAGDAVLVPRRGSTTSEPACRGCRCARPTTTCATRWWRRSPSEDVEFDILLQLQTDPFLMPIENNAVLWPTKLSPRVPAAVLRIPKQTFDSPEQLDFARMLSYNPWHSIPEHRPLGNQSRARKRMYCELSRLRQQMNGVEHYEPTGDEEFPGSTPISRARGQASSPPGSGAPRAPGGRSRRRP